MYALIGLAVFIACVKLAAIFGWGTDSRDGPTQRRPARRTAATARPAAPAPGALIRRVRDTAAVTPRDPDRDAERLPADDVEQVLALAGRAEVADQVGPLSEHAHLHLHRGGGPDLVARTPQGQVAGYAHLDGADAELVVDPDHASAGHGRALLCARSSGRGRRAAGPRVWAHGNLPAAVGFAAALGYSRCASCGRCSGP